MFSQKWFLIRRSLKNSEPQPRTISSLQIRKTRHHSSCTIHSRANRSPNIQHRAGSGNICCTHPGVVGRGELDSQTALELSTLTKNWFDSIYARQEYEIKLAAQGGGSEQTIRILGGGIRCRNKHNWHGRCKKAPSARERTCRSMYRSCRCPGLDRFSAQSEAVEP